MTKGTAEDRSYERAALACPQTLFTNEGYALESELVGRDFGATDRSAPTLSADPLNPTR